MVCSTLFLKRTASGLRSREVQGTASNRERAPGKGLQGTRRVVSASVSGQGTPSPMYGAARAAARPALPSSSTPASVALPGTRIRTGGAGGLQLHEARPGSVARAARGRSTSPRPFAAPSCGAVTRQGSALAASPQGLTATAADHPLRSAGVGAAHPADLPAFAVTAPHPATATGGSGRGGEAARFPVVMVAASREQSSRRLIRTTTYPSSLAPTDGSSA